MTAIHVARRAIAGQADVRGLVADLTSGQVCAHSYLSGHIVTDLAMVKLFVR